MILNRKTWDGVFLMCLLNRKPENVIWCSTEFLFFMLSYIAKESAGRYSLKEGLVDLYCCFQAICCVSTVEFVPLFHQFATKICTQMHTVFILIFLTIQVYIYHFLYLEETHWNQWDLLNTTYISLITNGPTLSKNNIGFKTHSFVCNLLTQKKMSISIPSNRGIVSAPIQSRHFMLTFS